MSTALLNLTRDECAGRSEVIKVDTYHIELDLRAIDDPETKTYASVTEIKFDSATPSTWLDLVADSVDSVTVNGKAVEVHYNGARVPLDGLLNGVNTVTVAAKCRYSRTGEGLHRFTDPVDGKTYAYTHFEPTDARRMYACFEQPDLKGRITFVITAPSSSGVFSNQSIEKEGTAGDIHTVTFAPTLPLSTYLSSIAVGPYHVVEDHWNRNGLEVPLAAICRQSMKQYLESEEIFRVTKQGLDFFDDAFKYPYPWGKYYSIFLPEYNIGAMEHPGLVTFNENAYIFRGTPSTAQRESRAEVILHEMAHMWFGDLATPVWWSGTWLKESFADLMGYLVATESAGFKGPWVTFALSRKQWAYTQDLLPSTHPIVVDVPDLEAARQNFDGITYAKGASVLKQLMAYAGRESFFAASQIYFQRHAFGATTLDDLITCLKEKSEADLSEWVPSWLETTGPSIITTVREGDDLFVTTESTDVLTQKPIARNHRVIVSTFARGPKGVERTAKVSVLLDSPRVKVPLPKGTVVDLAIANDDDLTYALLRFDDASVNVLVEQISTLQPTLTRAVAWSSLWNAVRDAKLPAARFLKAVHINAASETESGLLALVLGYAYSAITSYLPPKDRDAASDELVATVDAGLRQAPAGSDLQRAWSSRLTASGSLSKKGIDPLRNVLGGNISGLELTPTLRWNILGALASLGAADAAELKEEYTKDPTMTGATAYARALASLPGADVKKRVWTDLTTEEGITNDRQGALISGFNSGDLKAHAPFSEPYFANLTAWWAAMSMTMASRLVRGLFPGTSTEYGAAGDNSVEKAAQAWLDGNGDAPKALRRIIVEALDEVRRQLRAQAA
jgi:aminopeptidase N